MALVCIAASGIVNGLFELGTHGLVFTNKFAEPTQSVITVSYRIECNVFVGH